MSDKMLFGLAGEHLSHSLSPLIFNHFFQKSGLNSCYKLFSVKPDCLQEWLKRVKSTSILGLNVTIPYKEIIVRFLDDVDEEAIRIGSVNVVHNISGKLKGYNTDYLGFNRALQKYIPLKAERTVVLGAGGASRSVIYSLFKLGIQEIVFFARSRQRIENIIEDFSYIANLKGYEWQPDKIKETLRKAGLIVNATPVGMFPLEHVSPVETDFPERKGVVVFDLIYNPLETRFLKEAKKKGLFAENGLRMLVYQALESYKIWKNQPVNEEFFIQSSEEVLNASIVNRG